MSTSSPASTPSRRGFLHTFLVSTGSLLGLAALKRTAIAATKASEPMPDADSAKQGYRETQHVRAYYDSARF